MNKLGTIVTTSAAKQIAEQIRQAILDGRVKRNEQLPTETDLASQFGVSRPTIREALKRLAAQNLIRSRRGPAGGTFVNNYQIEDAAEGLTSATMLMVSLGTLEMSDIIAVRRFMEAECCRLAVEHWSPETLHKLDEALKRQGDPTLSDEDFCAADVAFHRAIVDAGGNAMLRYVMFSVIEALVPVMNMIVVHVRDRRDVIAFHRRMRDALAKRAPNKTRAALDELLDYLEVKYSEAVDARAQRRAGGRVG